MHGSMEKVTSKRKTMSATPFLRNLDPDREGGGCTDRPGGLAEPDEGAERAKTRALPKNGWKSSPRDSPRRSRPTAAM